MRKLSCLIVVLAFSCLLSGCQTRRSRYIDLGWTCPSHITPELIRQRAREQGIEIE